MRADLGDRAEAFRAWLRAWVAEHVPADLDRRGRRALSSDPAYEAALLDARLVCPSWPREFGGGGLSGLEVAVLNEEFAAAGVPRVTRGMGESLVGPSIIVHGSEEQRAEFLPDIVAGRTRWCQGFSEPDAGSDLASLQTRGVVDGDELVITGQKVWTSWYWDATHIFVLCRTDPDAGKHAGISYVLVPLRRPDGSANGVEFRPLRQLSGDSHFAETFLDGARAPLANVVGGLGNGWKVSMTTLGNERGGSATVQHLQHAADWRALVAELRRRGRTDDPVVRQHLAWAWSHVELMRYSGLRLVSALAESRDPGAGGSLSKVFWSEYQRRLGELALGFLGADGMVADYDDLDRWPRLFLSSRSHTIWGGTAEIQRNIIGEKVLGLPKEPPAT